MIESKENTSFKKAKAGAGKSATVYSNETVAELFFSVVPQAMRVFREEMRTHRSGAMSVPQFRILAQLWIEPSSNKELASRLGVSGAAMTRMVDSLVKEGLVARQMNKDDRRSIYIGMTKKGLSYFQKIRGSAILSLAARLGSLDGAVIDQMGAGLGLIAKALAELQLLSPIVISDFSFDR